MDTDANNPEFRKGMPPKLDHVKIYFSQKNIPQEEAEVFFYYHQDLDWRTESGLPIMRVSMLVPRGAGGELRAVLQNARTETFPLSAWDNGIAAPKGKCPL